MKRKRAAELMSEAIFGISAQVLQEFYAIATGPLRRIRLSESAALKWIERLELQPCLPVTASMVKNSILMSVRYRISYWDGAIIAAADGLRAKILYTEDLNHGQAYGGVTVVNSFIDRNAQTELHDNVQAQLAKD
jgi:predicted nucleic acid-binding protein